jgi:hypothetical protein
VASDVMLPVVVRRHAFQELRMDILEAMRANPDGAGLCARFEQAQRDVVATIDGQTSGSKSAVGLRNLEAQWGFGL